LFGGSEASRQIYRGGCLTYSTLLICNCDNPRQQDLSIRGKLAESRHGCNLFHVEHRRPCGIYSGKFHVEHLHGNLTRTFVFHVEQVVPRWELVVRLRCSTWNYPAYSFQLSAANSLISLDECFTWNYRWSFWFTMSRDTRFATRGLFHVEPISHFGCRRIGAVGSGGSVGLASIRRT
jgi:hypothetical protein